MTCPGFEKLVDYLDGTLSMEDTRAISVHIASGCAYCAADKAWYERVRALAASDDSIEPPSWVLKRALRLFEANREPAGGARDLGRAVAALVYDSLARPATVGVRSTETSHRQLLYRAAGYSIDVLIAPSEGSRADLMGQILREGEAGFGSVSGRKVELVRDGRAVGLAITDKVGEFKIASLDRGEYDLRIEASGGSIIVPGMPVSPT